MRVLIHICCGPCLPGPLEALRSQGHEVSGLFYNPNIHPLLEFRRRLKALRVYLEADPLEVTLDDEYGLETHLRQVSPLAPGRCARCYALRLGRTADMAADRGFDAFTTTLLVSRHQDHAVVRTAGEAAAARAGVRFVYQDFRSLADRCAAVAAERGLYRQTYCGCVFSEEERYRHTTRHLYRGPGVPGGPSGVAREQRRRAP